MTLRKGIFMPHFRKRQAEAKLAACKFEADKVLSAAKREVAGTLLRIFLVTAVTTTILVKIYYGMKS